MRKQPTTPSVTPHVDALCKTNGHDWHETISHTYRTCHRPGCHAAERLVHGSWVSATLTTSSRNKQHHISTPVSTPSLLWERQQYDALTFPYPGYDPQRERAAMQQYYKAIADESLYRAEQRRKRGGSCT